MIQTQLELLVPTEKLRVITLWQPWASLIALGLKRYETRSWGTDYRGKLVIHAAKRTMKEAEILAIYESLTLSGNVDREVEMFDHYCNTFKTPYRDFPLGCVVAIADLTDCLLMHPFKSRVTNYVETPKGGHIFIDQQSPLEIAVGDWQPDRYAWKLENTIALDQPIPHIGGQGLRYASEELKQRIGEALAPCP